MHRDAEFNRAHVPAFLAGEEPHKYLCVYPYVRSLEWYLLPADERREMLAEHGMMGREYPDVRANTVSSFALGDYEWLLAFEADDLGAHRRRHAPPARRRRHALTRARSCRSSPASASRSPTSPPRSGSGAQPNARASRSTVRGT